MRGPEAGVKTRRLIWAIPDSSLMCVGAVQQPLHAESHSQNRRAVADRDWPIYGGQKADDHYSPLAQINRSNVGKLAVAVELRYRREGRWPADESVDRWTNALRLHANAEGHRARRCNRKAAVDASTPA